VNGQRHESADLLPDKGNAANINYANNYQQDPTSMHVRLISVSHINYATGNCTGVNKKHKRNQITH